MPPPKCWNVRLRLKAQVFRDGQPIIVPVSAIIAGYTTDLAAGDLVPADGIVLAATAAQVNQAALTGEPFPVAKQSEPVAYAALAHAPNLVLQGSSVIGGTIRMLVVATGGQRICERMPGAAAIQTKSGAFWRSRMNRMAPTGVTQQSWLA